MRTYLDMRRLRSVSVSIGAVLIAGFLLAAMTGCDTDSRPVGGPNLVGSVIDSTGRRVAGARIGVSYLIPDHTVIPRLARGAVPSEAGFAGPSATSCSLSTNVPNPLDNGTVIRFPLAAADSVRVSIFDAGGNLITRLLDDSLPAGEHAVSWTIGTDTFLPYGPYVARLEVGSADTTCTTERRMFRQPIVPVERDFAAGGLATTSNFGSFTIPLSDLAVGEVVERVDFAGNVVGQSTVSDSVLVCAHLVEGESVHFACELVDIGDGGREVLVEIELD